MILRTIIVVTWLLLVTAVVFRGYIYEKVLYSEGLIEEPDDPSKKISVFKLCIFCNIIMGIEMLFWW